MGELAAAAQYDNHTVKSFLMGVVPGAVEIVVTIAGTAVALAYLEPQLLVLAFVPLPVVGLLAYLYTNKITPLATHRNEMYGEVYSTIQEALHALEDIKVYDHEDEFPERLRKEARELEDVTVNLEKQQHRIFPAINTGIALMLVGILVGGGHFAVAGTITVGTLVAYYYYVSRALGPLRSASSLVVSFQAAKAAVKRIRSVLEAPIGEKSGGDALSLAVRAADLSFQRVSFAYSTYETALETFNLDIPAGHRVALLGPSGSGKSTTGKLIPRLFDPQEGRILRNGVDLRELDIEELRATIGYVGQDVFLFDGSIRENILFGGDEDTDEAQLRKAVEHACVDEILERKDCDLDAPVGEGGAMLSGGQKKRVALARALVRDPSILVIDQLAADLQEDLCREIFESIRRHYEVSILYLGHRVPAGFDPDAVYWMEEGTIKRRMEPTEYAHGAA
jgi:ABC-type multidrug transport system fused ATPase/permease subunit